MKKGNVRANKHSTKFQDTNPTYNNQWYIYKSIINNQKGNEENQGIPPKTKKHSKIRQDTDADAGKYIYIYIYIGVYIHLQCRRPRFNPWVGKIPWRRQRLLTPVFWPGEFHGLYSPWGCKAWNMTEQFTLSLLH